MEKRLFSCFILLLICGAVMAQEPMDKTEMPSAVVANAPIVPAEASNIAVDASSAGVELAYGTFAKFSDGIMSVSEYDAEKDAQVETSYIINSDTKVVNADSVDKISAGSNIEIAYETSGGKKTAKAITVEKIEPQQQ